MNNISVVVISRAKEKYLKEVLTSVQWVNEIILVIDTDQDFTDSETIGGKFAATILKRKLDKYVNQKNFGIERARNEWVLSLDSDEILSEELQDEIKNLKIESVEGYSIPFKNYLGKKWLRYAGLYPDYHLRLFKKSKAKFSGEIHEQVVLEGNFGYLKSPILHYTYENTGDYLEKVRKYSVLEAASDFNSGKKVTIVDDFRIGLKFLKLYFFKLGFMDGWSGLISVSLLTYYYWLKNKKIRSLESSK